MSKEGNIGSNMKESAQSIASMADWFDVRELDISGEAGNVVIATKYPTMVCKGFKNLSSSAAATVIFTTKNNSEVSVTFPLDVGEFSGKLPQINSIVKAGTSDNILLYFQSL
jgi:hypothetical protein